MKSNLRPALLLAGIVLVVFLVYSLLDRGRSTDDGSGSYTVAIFSYVSHPVLDEVRLAFEESLRQLAGHEGALIDFRRFNAEGSDTQIAALSTSILSQAVDLIVPIATPVSRQLVQDSPPGMPIIYSFVTNPENLGSERFEKNVTGVSDAVNYPANIELLFSWFPRTKKVGMLFNPAEPNSVDAVTQARPLVEARGARLVVSEVTSGAEVANAATALAGEVDLFYVGGDNTVVGAMPSLVEVTRRQGKAVFASDSGSVQAGALAAVSVRYSEIGEVTAEIAWRVLHESVAPEQISPISVSGKEILYNPESAQALSAPVPESYVGSATPVPSK